MMPPHRKVDAETRTRALLIRSCSKVIVIFAAWQPSTSLQRLFNVTNVVSQRWNIRLGHIDDLAHIP